MKKIILYTLLLATCINTHAMQTTPCAQFKQLRTFLGILLTGYCTYGILYSYLKKTSMPLSLKDTAAQKAETTLRKRCRKYMLDLKHNTPATLPEINDTKSAKQWYEQFLQQAIACYTPSNMALSQILPKLDPNTSISLLLQASNLPHTVMQNIAVQEPLSFIQKDRWPDNNANANTWIAFLKKAGMLMANKYSALNMTYHYWFFTISNISDIPSNHHDTVMTSIQQDATIEVNDIKKFLQALYSCCTTSASIPLALILFTKTNAWQKTLQEEETPKMQQQVTLFSDFQTLFNDRISAYVCSSDTEQNEQKITFEKMFDTTMQKLCISSLRAKDFRPQQQVTTSTIQTEAAQATIA